MVSISSALTLSSFGESSIISGVSFFSSLILDNSISSASSIMISSVSSIKISSVSSIMISSSLLERDKEKIVSATSFLSSPVLNKSISSFSSITMFPSSIKFDSVSEALSSYTLGWP